MIYLVIWLALVGRSEIEGAFNTLSSITKRTQNHTSALVDKLFICAALNYTSIGISLSLTRIVAKPFATKTGAM